MKLRRSGVVHVANLFLLISSLLLLSTESRINSAALAESSSFENSEELPPGKPSSSKAKPAPPSSPAQPQQPESVPAPTSQPAHDLSLWEKYSRLIGKSYYVFDDDFVSCPKFNPDYPSSKGITVSQVRQQNVRTTYVDNGTGAKMPVQTDMLMEEAQAIALPMPAIALGEYGYILSGNIKEIIGPDEMWLDQIWLIDSTELNRYKDQLRLEAQRQDAIDRERNANSAYGNNSGNATSSLSAMQTQISLGFVQRDRLAVTQRTSEFQRGFIVRGVPTQGLAPRTRWSGENRQSHGVQLAIVDAKVQGNERKDQRIYVAVPVSLLLHHLDESQFLEMLTKRKLTSDQFIDLVEQERKRDLKNFEINIIRKLDAMKSPKPTEESDPKNSAKNQPQNKRNKADSAN